MCASALLPITWKTPLTNAELLVSLAMLTTTVGIVFLDAPPTLIHMVTLLIKSAVMNAYEASLLIILPIFAFLNAHQPLIIMETQKLVDV